jgi:hypothetical protein
MQYLGYGLRRIHSPGTLVNKTSSDASGLAEWHIYSRVKATKESAMTSSNLLRWGGLAALIGGGLYVLTGIMSLLAPQEEVFDSFTDYLIEVLFVLALVGTLMAIAGVHVLQRERYGRLGAAGSWTAFVGHALLLVVAAATTLAGREVLDMVFLLGSLAALVGLVLLGATTLRARVLPRGGAECCSLSACRSLWSWT